MCPCLQEMLMSLIPAAALGPEEGSFIPSYEFGHGQPSFL